MRKLLHHMSICRRCDRPQMLMQAEKIGRRLAGPLNPHALGEGSGLSVERLSAQAGML